MNGREFFASTALKSIADSENPIVTLGTVCNPHNSRIIPASFDEHAASLISFRGEGPIEFLTVIDAGKAMSSCETDQEDHHLYFYLHSGQSAHFTQGFEGGYVQVSHHSVFNFHFPR